MPKGKALATPLPRDAKFTIVDGQNFVRLREAAKLAGIHPVVLEMGKELLSRVGGSGASFALATPELQKAGDEIARTFKVGLRRFAKAMEPQKKIKLKAYRDGNRLVFWYSS
jgi:hypothetical protein